MILSVETYKIVVLKLFFRKIVIPLSVIALSRSDGVSFLTFSSKSCGTSLFSLRVKRAISVVTVVEYAQVMCLFLLFAKVQCNSTRFKEDGPH